MSHLRVRHLDSQLRRYEGLFSLLNKKTQTGAGERLAKIIRALNRRDYGGITGVNHELNPLWGRLVYIPPPAMKRGGFVWLVNENLQNSTVLTLGLHRIMGLVERRLIHRVRECRCGKWFFAKRNNHDFCSDRCRQDDYRTSPQGKKNRNASQQRYRKSLRAMGEFGPVARARKTENFRPKKGGK